MNIGDIIKIKKETLENGYILGYTEEDRYEIIGFGESLIHTPIAYLRSVGNEVYEDYLPVSMIELA